ncbi:MAG: hypothetical protein HZB31_14190 [Nitrospirae bacterium]|nr:hypothetical protein [Nitrospirota bacterium]
MDYVVGLLKKWASGKLVLGLFIATMAVYLTMLLYTLPAVERFVPGKALFDLSPAGYSYEYAVSLLEVLGPEGRRMYLYRQLPMDFIYPGLFAISYSLLLTWIFSKGYASDSKIINFAVIPFFGGLFDYLENICIIQLIKSYPTVSHGLVGVSSTFTILKSGFTIAFFILLLVGVIKVIKKRVTNVNSQS